MDRYEVLKDIGSGNFGVAKLVKDKWSGELCAVKYIERGSKVIFLASFILFLSSQFTLFFVSFGWERDGSCILIWVSVSFVHFYCKCCYLLSESCLFLFLNCFYDLVFWIFQIDEHVQREIMNHRSLKHPNIIRFKEVIECHNSLLMEMFCKPMSFILMIRIFRF